MYVLCAFTEGASQEDFACTNIAGPGGAALDSPCCELVPCLAPPPHVNGSNPDPMVPTCFIMNGTDEQAFEDEYFSCPFHNNSDNGAALQCFGKFWGIHL